MSIRAFVVPAAIALAFAVGPMPSDAADRQHERGQGRSQRDDRRSARAVSRADGPARVAGSRERASQPPRESRSSQVFRASSEQRAIARSSAWRGDRSVRSDRQPSYSDGASRERRAIPRNEVQRRDHSLESDRQPSHSDGAFRERRAVPPSDVRRGDRSVRSNRQPSYSDGALRERHAVPRDEVRPRDSSGRSFGPSYTDGASHHSRRAYHGGPAPGYPASYIHGYGGAYRYSRPAYGYRGYHYRPWLLPSYRPYYSFRPRFSIGFGIYVGYPVAFSAWYGYGPRYGYPAAYAYPAPRYYAHAFPGYGSGGAYTNYGGMSFEIDPPYTEVYVDGQYVGTTATFSATAQPLFLAPGRHRVELQAPGFQPVVIDLDVVPGQIIPYRGSLVPY